MRRVIAVVASLVLATVGTFLLVRYVQGAEERALSGETLVDVWVVDTAIEPGTLAEDLTTAIRLEQVPAKVAAEGVISDLEQLDGLVPSVELIPGEQVVVSRFLGEEDYLALIAEGPAVVVPPDTLEVTVSLSPERAVGGELRPGEEVVVFASFQPFPLNAVEPSELDPDEIPVFYPTGTGEDDTDQAGLRTPSTTKIILHRVLVTNVQAEELPPEPTEEQQSADVPDLAPTGNLLITLALSPVDAERLVFTAEHGTIWLAREGADADQSDTEVQTRETVYLNEPQ